MSCLKIDILPISSKLHVECDKIGGITASLRILKSGICSGLRAVASAISGIFASAKPVGAELSVSAARIGSDASLSVGIICAVGLDTEYYLQVFEGNIITIDGCFIKVMKG